MLRGPAAKFGADAASAGTKATGFAPAVFDAEVGRIFVTIRSMLGLGLWDMARAVGAEPGTIANLEAGALSDLPDWPETTRIVGAYAALAEIEAQPVLARLERRWAGPVPAMAAVASASPAMVAAAAWEPAWDKPTIPIRAPIGYGAYSAYDTRSVAASADEADSEFAPEASPPANPEAARRPRGRQHGAPRTGATAQKPKRTFWADAQRSLLRPLRSLSRMLLDLVRGRALALALVLGCPAVVVAAIFYAPALVYEVVVVLPGPIARPVRTALDALVVAIAPVDEEGLTSIDVGDPAIRKADRLPVAPAAAER